MGASSLRSSNSSSEGGTDRSLRSCSPSPFPGGDRLGRRLRCLKALSVPRVSSTLSDGSRWGDSLPHCLLRNPFCSGELNAPFASQLRQVFLCKRLSYLYSCFLVSARVALVNLRLVRRVTEIFKFFVQRGDSVITAILFPESVPRRRLTRRPTALFEGPMCSSRQPHPGDGVSESEDAPNCFS